jgi:hypothetical protein
MSRDLPEKDDNIRREPPPPLRARPVDSDENEWEEPPHRQIRIDREEVIAPADLIVPINVNIWSLLAAYLGLVGFCLPFVGIPFAVLGVLFAVLAMRSKKGPGGTSYGKVTGDIRAWAGLILGVLGLLIWGGIGSVLLLNALLQ